MICDYIFELWVCFFNFEHAEGQKHKYRALLLTLLHAFLLALLFALFLAVFLRSQNSKGQINFWGPSFNLSRSRTA